MHKFLIDSKLNDVTEWNVKYYCLQTTELKPMCHCQPCEHTVSASICHRTNTAKETLFTVAYCSVLHRTVAYDRLNVYVCSATLVTQNVDPDKNQHTIKLCAVLPLSSVNEYWQTAANVFVNRQNCVYNILYVFRKSHKLLFYFILSNNFDR